MYEGREIVTFPVKNTGYLISQVIPPSVLIFTKFVVISLSTPISWNFLLHWKLSYSRVTAVLFSYHMCNDVEWETVCL